MPSETNYLEHTTDNFRALLSDSPLYDWIEQIEREGRDAKIQLSAKELREQAAIQEDAERLAEAFLAALIMNPGQKSFSTHGDDCFTNHLTNQVKAKDIAERMLTLLKPYLPIYMGRHTQAGFQLCVQTIVFTYNSGFTHYITITRIGDLPAATT